LVVTADLKERIAINLWHRFAPEGHMEWAEERHAAEYRDAADAVLFLAQSHMTTSGFKPVTYDQLPARKEFDANFLQMPIRDRLRRAMESTTDAVLRNDLRDILRGIPDAAQSAVTPGVIERMVTDAWDDSRRQTIEECAKISESYYSGAEAADEIRKLAAQPPAAPVSNSAELACGNSSQASQRHDGDLQPSSAEAPKCSSADTAKVANEIANEVHATLSRVPGANLYNAAHMAAEAVLTRYATAPQEAVKP
jgi:hypothetical protein